LKIPTKPKNATGEYSKYTNYIFQVHFPTAIDVMFQDELEIPPPPATQVDVKFQDELKMPPPIAAQGSITFPLLHNIASSYDIIKGPRE